MPGYRASFPPPARNATEISTARLDAEDRFHCLSFGRGTDLLSASIQQVGLLNPLLVSPGKGTRLTLVCGFRRLEALRSLGVESIPCRIWDRPLTPEERLVTSFWDNLTHRGFNLVETSRVVDRFLTVWGPEKTRRIILPLLELHPHDRELERMQKIAGMPEPVLTALNTGRLALDSALSLLDFPEEDRSAVFQVLRSLNLSVSLQKEFLETLRDLTLRDNVPARVLLASGEVREILKHPRWSTPQKAGRLRALLRRRLHPRLTEAEHRFARRVASLKLPPRIRIEPEPGFEEEGIRIRLRARTPQELRGLLSRLAEAEEERDLQALFRLPEEQNVSSSGKKREKADA